MNAEAVDLLINARWVAPVVPENALYQDCSVAVRDGRIVDLQPRAEAGRRYRAGRELDLDNHLLIPGLVNSHGHAAMTLLRGYADDLPLERWLTESIWPAEGRWMSEEFVRDGTEIALAEMLKSGTTCFSDMYFFPNQTAAMAWQHGVRCQLTFPVIDFPSAWARDAEDYLHKGLALHDSYRDNDLVSIAFGPHAPHTVADTVLRKIAVIASELDAGIHIHLHETADEVEATVTQSGVRPLRRLHDMGLLTPNTQCVHMTQVDDEDIRLLAESGASVIHCPRSNLKLGSGFCPVEDLRRAGIPVALGTDGAASNNSLSMLAEMQMASLLAKGVSRDATALDCHRALAMATLEGARALGLGAVTGSIEAGKHADLVALDLGDIRHQPMYNPLSHLVYGHTGDRVSHVWINGKPLVADGALQTFNEHELASKARQWQQRISG